MRSRDDADLDLEWLANWLHRVKDERGLGVVEIARLCRVDHPRISQLKNPRKYRSPPGVELFSRLMAIYHCEEEWAALSDDAVRASLLRLMAALGPSRLHYLASISSSDAQALVDEDQRKRESRRRLALEDHAPKKP